MTNNLTSSRTLYPCLCIISEDVLNPSQSFNNFLDNVYYFSKINTDLLFTHTASIILFVLSIVYMFPILQFKPNSNKNCNFLFQFTSSCSYFSYSVVLDLNSGHCVIVQIRLEYIEHFLQTTINDTNNTIHSNKIHASKNKPLIQKSGPNQAFQQYMFWLKHY